MIETSQISKKEVCKVFGYACSKLRIQLSTSTHFCTDKEIATVLCISPVTLSRCLTGVCCPSGTLLLKSLFLLQRNNDLIDAVNCILNGI